MSCILNKNEWVKIRDNSTFEMIYSRRANFTYVYSPLIVYQSYDKN